ncbi:aminoglycoside phosphotransferase family protein [Cellulosimicrobium protaetiae]|uniref:Aminoglycoside phosphotransferase family protein n=1 Tax=Cellulosimicrobium protaetiae TaxID=2587808 RepID=A0A6M5UGR2_9MICO|nr:aminoglycoside phosphotransferase family protein [Cellulosimicrobium protaetiae]QJW37370.1 aminoglycoside phosphotransferase family protein [Cellulosimicrobium protaetiae]
MTDLLTYRDDADDVEVPLLGGDVSDGVVRRGGTVRRPRGPHSPAVEAYLLHLEAAGFERAPRFLGVDDDGREVVTFLPGEMGGRPPHAWATDEDLLVQLGEWLRDLHAVSCDVVLPEGVSWPERVQFAEVPDVFDVPDVVGHNDLTVENALFVPAGDDPQGPYRLVGVIDFDMAAPTTRLLDVATSLLYWAPVAPPEARPAVLRGLDAPRRTRILTEAYGLDRAERLALLDVLAQRFARSWYAMRHAAQARGGGWQRMWDDGVGDRIRENEAWFASQRVDFVRALD